MKRVPIPVLVLLVSLTTVSAQQTSPLPDPVTSIAGEAANLVIDNLPRQTGDPPSVVVQEFWFDGRVTPLGTLFIETISNQLVEQGGRRISVLAGEYASDAPPDYRLRGTIYEAGSDIYVTVQLIRAGDASIMGGFERSFPMSAPLRSLLWSPGGPAAGSDHFEPDSIDNPSTLPIDIPVTGRTITPEGDEDWFLLDYELIEGMALVEIHTTGPTDTWLTVFGPDDPYRQVTENDDYEDHNARVSFSVGPGESFWVRVTGFDDTVTGPYGIEAGMAMYGEDPNEPDNVMEDANRLEIDGEPFPAMIMPAGDVDWYAIDVPSMEGDIALLVIETTGDQDTWIEFFDASGEYLAEDDDGSGTGNARLQYTLTEPGRYYAMVRHYDEFGTGPYDVFARLERVTPDEYEPDDVMEEATPLTLGGMSQVHTFTTGSDSDWFTFQVSERMTVVMETSGSSDTVMRLLDEGGNIIDESDDDGDGNNAMIQRFLLPGTYFLEITSFSGTGGSGLEYSIRVGSG